MSYLVCLQLFNLQLKLHLPEAGVSSLVVLTFSSRVFDVQQTSGLRLLSVGVVLGIYLTGAGIMV